MLHGMKDTDSYLMCTLPPLYKCIHVKRRKMVASTFLSLVWKNFPILSPMLVLAYAEDIARDSTLKKLC